MAGKCKIPEDPEVYKQLIEDLALGLPQVQICRALGITENTLTNWKKRKIFGRDLALKKLEILRDPVKAILDRNPLAFVERHPDTREQFKPPTLKTESETKVNLYADRSIEELIAIAQTGCNPGSKS